jgi:hypothetical protein
MAGFRRSALDSGLKNNTDFLDFFIGSRKTRRKSPWYNKTVYGTLNDLFYDLVNLYLIPRRGEVRKFLKQFNV